jgi:glycine/sarcosine N-methyltransferase
MNFYSSLAPDYDRMTRFQERLAPEAAVLKRWIDPAKMRTALDAACGTGLHAILLAKMGLRVTGVDLSADMIAQAKSNAKRQGVDVAWFAGDMRNLLKQIKGPFGAVFCLGNSLPHLLTKRDLARTLRGFRKLLRPGGWLLLQVLNYDRILKAGQRIVGVHRQGDTEYIRFYDFKGRYVNFNILRITQSRGKLTHALSTTTLRPYKQKELTAELLKCGFKDLKSYGSLEQTPFDPESSPNLILTAH